MRNIWTILKRDFKRLIRVPAAWVIVIGIMFIPCFYAWLNIYGFWNPYNNTSAIQVAVANEDKGAKSSLLGDVHLGDQIVEKLRNNHELGWQFDSTDEAMTCVKSGECYAAIVIPSDFSEKVTNILTDPASKPTLDYYVNEKANAIAPRITEIGATTVDREVNNSFVSTVSGIISEMVNDTSADVQTTAGTTVATAVNRINETSQGLKDAQQTLGGLETKLKTIPEKTNAAREALTHVTNAATSASDGLNTASGLLTSTQTSINDFQAQAMKAVSDSGSLLTKVARSANGNVSTVTAGVTAASGYTAGALGTLSGVNSSIAGILTDLKGVDLSGISSSANSQLQSIVNDLSAKNSAAGTTINDLTSLNSNIANTASSLNSAMDGFQSATDNSVNALNTASDKLSSTALPDLNSGLSQLATASGSLAASVDGSSSLVNQAGSVLSELDNVANTSLNAITSTDQLLGDLQDQLSQISTDLSALSSSNTLAELFGSDGKLNASAISDFMMSPTVLKTTTLYPVNSYGSGMAPLFTSLALWVGIFMMMALFKLEVDDEGLEGRYVTGAQKYWARFLLLAPIAMMQGLICTTGDLIIGVQCASVPVFLLTGMILSLCYLSICYMLSTAFMHVGKALIIVLVMVMIPGASGLYPIELMPHFFQEMYPFFPFTYAIAALRETIGGFYDGHWVKDILMLVLFAVLAFCMGLLLRPLLANLNRLFAREIKESDVIAGETVYLPERRFSAAKVLEALSDQSGYQQQIQSRARRFDQLYPKLLRGALVAGIVVPLILFIVFSVINDGKKMAALAAWCIWLLIMVAFLMIVEYLHDSLSREVAMSTADDETLIDMFTNSLREKVRARGEKEGRKAAKWHLKRQRHLEKHAAKHGASNKAALTTAHKNEGLGGTDGSLLTTAHKHETDGSVTDTQQIEPDTQEMEAIDDGKEQD